MNTQTSNPDRGILHLISHTPLRDIARFRLSGRLDFERHLAGLPAPVADHIRAVVRRTRLWRLEKVEIARELAAHCADGLAQGRSPQQVIRAFGEARPAARLIALAARRKRPLGWKVLLRSAQAAALLALIALIAYGYFAIRYFGSHVTIARNYAAEINAPLAAIPADQRALAPYHQAWAALGRPLPGEGLLTMIRPGDPRWPSAVEYLHKHADALDMARRAADLPHLGASIRGDLDPVLYPESAVDAPSAPENPFLISVLCPHWAEIRHLSRHLIADIRLAASEHDANRVAADAQAILKMSNHIREQPMLIGDLVALSILTSGLNELGRTLHDQPDLLSESQLTNLAHRLASWGGGGRLTARLDLERISFDDLLQRTFSDDGRGDGHPTADGAQILDSLASSSGDPANVALRRITQPVASAMMASRREQHDAYNRILDRAEARARRPLWEWDRIEGPDAFERSLLDPSPAQRLRYLPVQILLPSTDKVAASAEYATQIRDAALVAIALTLHHRRTGTYPSSLEALVPTFLPSVPPDRFDGGPIRYRLADGVPVVYSVGVDRKDDGGQQSSISERARVSQWLPISVADANLAGPSVDLYKGDWILWPAAPPPPPPMPEP